MDRNPFSKWLASFRSRYGVSRQPPPSYPGTSPPRPWHPPMYRPRPPRPSSPAAPPLLVSTQTSGDLRVSHWLPTEVVTSGHHHRHQGHQVVGHGGGLQGVGYGGGARHHGGHGGGPHHDHGGLPGHQHSKDITFCQVSFYEITSSHLDRLITIFTKFTYRFSSFHKYLVYLMLASV